MMNRILSFILFFFVCCAIFNTVNAAVVGKSTSYEVDGETMKGFIAYDDSITGSRPGVIVVHEWWGHNEYARKRAKMLAELGYTAIALDMYGEGRQASHPKDAGKMAGEIRNNKDKMIHRFQAAKKILQNNQFTNKDKIAAIGYCFGGGVVLEIARSGENLAGVVSFHGSLATSSPATANNVKAKVLVLNGADDPFTKPEQITQFKQEMENAHVDYKFISYPGAKHAFTNPDADEFGKKFGIPLAYNKTADEKSWSEMQKFFNKIFH
jgi:dienelactone hydrolase